MSKNSPLRILPTEVQMSLEDIGKSLRLARKVRGETLETAAQRCGVHEQTISRIERGDPGVSIGSVFSLLSQYGKREALFNLARDDDETIVLMRRERGG